MAPVILELKASGFSNFKIVNTQQHKDLLKLYWDIFGLEADYELDVISNNQSLSSLTSKSIDAIQNLLDGFAEQRQVVKMIVAQGDTTTVMAASVVAFYNKVKFVHVEAGLRSFDFENPFPEEFNRKVAAINASIHLTPTQKAKQNLLDEGIASNKIHLVGNTVVDALEFIKKTTQFTENRFVEKIKTENPQARIVLITCHRRENQGDKLTAIIESVLELAECYKDILFIWTLHPNPNVKAIVENSAVADVANIKLVPPLEYADLLALINQCAAIITDSGGIQEEAPSFHVPVLVLREVTERPEAVELGFSYLVGTDKEVIIGAFKKAVAPGQRIDYYNPYGDGQSAVKIANLLISDLKSK